MEALLVSAAGGRKEALTTGRGSHARELTTINKSLLALWNCVAALTNGGRTHVPYRDSVLTRLLQPCLEGESASAFIVTCSPSALAAERHSRGRARATRSSGSPAGR